jgi:outer membrane protein TolC
MRFGRLKTFNSIQYVTMVPVLLGLLTIMAPAKAQMGGFSLQPVTYQSFAPQSFAKPNAVLPSSAILSSAKLPMEGTQASDRALTQTAGLATELHKSVFPTAESFARKPAGDLFETASFTPVSAAAAQNPQRRKQGFHVVAPEGRSGSSEGTSPGVDANRSLPLQPLLQDVLNASIDYERLKDKVLLLDVTRGGGAGKTAGKIYDPQAGLADETDSLAGPPVKTLSPFYLTLDSALNAARRRSPQIKGARSAQSASYYNSLATLGGYGPKVDFRDSRGRESSNNGLSSPAVSYPDHERVDKTLTLRQPIFDLNIMAGYKRDVANEELAGIGRDVTEDQITQEVVTVYFDLLQSLVGVSLADEFQSRLQDLMTYISSRAEGGAVSDVELQRVQAASLSAERIKFEALSARDIALTALGRLVGKVPGQVAFPARSIAAMPKDTERAMPLLIARNAELKANQKQVEVAFYEQAVALTRFAPKFDLEVGQYDSKNPSGVAGKTQDRRTMVTMSVNLANGGSDYAYARAQSARREQVEFQYQSVYEKTVERLRVYYLTLQGVDKQILNAKKEYQTYKTVSDEYDRQLSVAPKSITDLLDVNNKLYQAKINLVNLNIKRIQLIYTINYYIKEF